MAGGVRGSELVINFLPVRFTDGHFEAGTLPYESPEQLDALRVRLVTTHTVIRMRDQAMYVPLSTDAEVVGEPATFDMSGPNLAGQPVTILYSDLIADLLGQLRPRHQLEFRHAFHQTPLEQVVPVTSPERDATDEPLLYLGGQLSALRHRVETANVPGNLDGLLARDIMRGSPDITWHVDPFSGTWLEENALRFEAPRTPDMAI